ncbi:TPA: hypothetical protein OR109_003135 [Escherichia coli]|uniref:hypothetical protein n=1 Tax=Escherichia coli TaxID=562 RepID=UPI001B0F208D|nr:hypothetical protein [Escherichia coli]HBA5209814.1 hypothetical protein [Escherichia coli]HCS6404385.1 hypothetical protein [Escherichia coli]HDW1482367.1 hypothetical protein [Escherichia coli]
MSMFLIKKKLKTDELLLTRKYWIDSPSSSLVIDEKNPVVEIRGWIQIFDNENVTLMIKYGEIVEEFSPEIERNDVVRSLNSNGSYTISKCGYRHKVVINNLSILNLITLNVKINGQCYELCSLNIRKIIKVKEGKSGWLFLDNDTNRSVDQFTGKKLISNTDLIKYMDFFSAIDGLSNKLNFSWCYSISPGKEFIFHDYHPNVLGNINPMIQILNLCVSNVICPIDDLFESRELSYWKGDTHWTDYGALLACMQIFNFFNIDVKGVFDSISFKISKSYGDLGSKLIPPIESDKLSYIDSKSFMIFNNGIINHGRISIYENSKAKTSYNCVIFGDSFSVSMCPWLALVFKKVTWIYSAGSVDKQILEYEKPDYVILQCNSRFLLTPPTTEYSIKESIINKLKHGNVKHDFQDVKYKESDSFFYSKMMFDVMNMVYHHKS